MTLDQLREAVRDVVREELGAAVRRLERGRKALMSQRAAAARLGIDRNDLAELVHDKLIRVVPMLRGAPRVPETEIERIMNEGLTRVRARRKRKEPPTEASSPEDILSIDI